MSDLRQLLPTVDPWIREGKCVASATVIRTWNSAPRRPGARLFVSEAFDIAGSVSAGCVEAAVIEAAQTVICTGLPQRLHYGVADSDAFEVGLACGGEIDLYVERWEPDLHRVVANLAQSRDCFEVLTDMQAGFHSVQGKDGIVYSEFRTNPDLTPSLDSPRCFLQRVSHLDQIIIIGGNHIAAALVKLASVLGYHLTLIDPRRTFASPERFPEIDRIIGEYPQYALPSLTLNERSAVVVLSHDPKFDDPALDYALRSEAGYIGALGSQHTQQQRCERLRMLGFTHEQITRIHGPIGLAIGAATPEQIALAILAEIVQTFAGHNNLPELTLLG